MGSRCFLPAGTYFVGDATHMYLSSPDAKPPLLDESVESNQACLDWLLHEVAYEHVHAARHMVGVTTGQQDQVTVLATSDMPGMWEKTFVHMPHFTLFVIPATILTPAFVRQVDPEGRHGVFVTFHADVDVLVCVEDWVESRGYLRMEDETRVVLLEWGAPTCTPLMPARSDVRARVAPHPGYSSISDQDLHALFLHLCLQTSSSSSSSDGSSPPFLHCRLRAHLRLCQRHALLDTDDVTGPFHEVCRELASRSVRAAADADNGHRARERSHFAKRRKVFS